MTIRASSDKVPASPVNLREYGAMDMAARRKIWLGISDISEADLDAHVQEERAREARVPQPGQRAPDFTAHVLDRNRMLSGETVTLSRLLGRPVGVIFGSFT